MALIDDLEGLDVASVLTDGPCCLIDPGSLLTKGLDVASVFAGGPFYAEAPGAAPPAHSGGTTRVYPGLVRVYPGVVRVFPV